MKGIQFILVLCLFVSLCCNKNVLRCAINKLPNSLCDQLVEKYKKFKAGAVGFLLTKKTILLQALNSCL
jgi:hypothetical protein